MSNSYKYNAMGNPPRPNNDTKVTGGSMGNANSGQVTIHENFVHGATSDEGLGDHDDWAHQAGHVDLGDTTTHGDNLKAVKHGKWIGY